MLGSDLPRPRDLRATDDGGAGGDDVAVDQGADERPLRRRPDPVADLRTTSEFGAGPGRYRTDVLSSEAEGPGTTISLRCTLLRSFRSRMRLRGSTVTSTTWSPDRASHTRSSSNPTCTVIVRLAPRARGPICPAPPSQRSTEKFTSIVVPAGVALPLRFCTTAVNVTSSPARGFAGSQDTRVTTRSGARWRRWSVCASSACAGAPAPNTSAAMAAVVAAVRRHRPSIVPPVTAGASR